MASSLRWPSLWITNSSTGSLLRSIGVGGGAPGRADQHGPGADRGELPLELARRAQRVERNGDGAGAEHREVGGNEVPVVGADDADAVTRVDAEPDEPGPQAADLLAELAVGGGAPPADQGGGVVGMGVDDRGEIHGDL
jgi:hypothetical protein